MTHSRHTSKSTKLTGTGPIIIKNPNTLHSERKYNLHYGPGDELKRALHDATAGYYTDKGKVLLTPQATTSRKAIRAQQIARRKCHKRYLRRCVNQFARNMVPGQENLITAQTLLRRGVTRSERNTAPGQKNFCYAASATTTLCKLLIAQHGTITKKMYFHATSYDVV